MQINWSKVEPRLRRNLSRCQLLWAFFALVICSTTTSLAADADIAVRIVNAMQALFGVHHQFRPVHAKGVMCEGDFTPAAGAALLTRAEHVQGKVSRVLVRFSDFAGLPSVSDTGAFAGPRGMAIKFMLAGGADTDIVAHSYNGFPVSTPEDFLAFLNALTAATHAGPPGQRELDEFAASHPHARAFLDDPMPPPSSYATETFYGVDAFKFTNAAGDSRYGRYVIQPFANEAHLTLAETAGRADNFLIQELTERLRKGPVRFRIMVQLAQPGDVVTDAAVAWPKTRPMIELGVLSIDQISVDSGELQKKLLFTPMNLPSGISGSGDPLLSARTRAYNNSYGRRQE